MARLSMNELTTYRWSFEEDVEQYVAAGYDAISVWRHKLSDIGEEKGAELLAESPLKVASLLWAGGFTGSDGRSHRESIDDAREAIRLADLMRADCLILYSGTRSGHTHNHARRLLNSAIAELLPLAADLKVTLALEPMHGACASEFTFLTSFDDAVALVDAQPSPYFKLVFDTYHFGQDAGLIARLPELAPRIAIVHLGDTKEPPSGEQNRCRLCEGNVPLAQIIATLRDAGYQGYFDIELMGEEFESANYSELLRQARRAFYDLMSTTRTA